MPHVHFGTGGKMGESILNHTWSKHDLGQIEQWPQTLCSTLDICLHSPFPMAVCWGSELSVLYNDAMTPILGDRHPGALGRPAKEVWSDIWEVIGDNIVKTYSTGQGTIAQNALLPLYRRGYTEEAYFDYTINPVFDEAGNVAGILLVANEVTQQILAARRSHILHQLSEQTQKAESPEEACIFATNVLLDAPEDIPFAHIYLLSSKDQQVLKLVADVSIDDTLKPTQINLNDHKGVLPYKEVLETQKRQVIYNIGESYNMGGSVWPEAPRHLVMIPITRRGSDRSFGIVVAGISPRLFYDDSYGNFLEDAVERISSAIANARDVQDRNIYEALEKKARAQLEAALTGGSIGTWTWDYDTKEMTLGNNAALIFGTRERTLPLDTWLNSLDVRDQTRFKLEARRAMSKNKRFEGEYHIQKSEGDSWVLIRGELISPTHKRERTLCGVVIDITDRKRTELELARSEQVFKALFDSSIVGMAIAQHDGTIVDANTAFLKMFRYTRVDLRKGLHSDMLTSKESTKVTRQFYESLRRTGEASPINKVYVRKDGTTVPGLVGAVMIPGSEDRFISFILDLSEQAHLRELNKAKDEFISIASHQLRTPATGVKQYLGMILQGFAGTVDAKQQQLIQIAYDSNERQLTIINDLLRVAQADAKEISVTKEPTEMVGFLRNVLNEQSIKFKEKSQSLQFHYTQKRISADIDSFYFHMVLENILDNASKYTEDGKSISIRLRSTRTNVIITIEDKGVGIRQRDISKLFKKFSRIDNPLSTAAGGSGLGLYWAKKVIDLHHGNITVDSKRGSGTTFTISIPKKSAPRRKAIT